MISGRQIRAARALVGLSQEDLAAAAGLTVQTIGRMEASGAEPVTGLALTLAAVLAALRANGVEVVPGGVMLTALGNPLVSPARSAAQVAADPK
jgi:DNA-binding XRE family transcriptional regulator